MSGKRRPRTRWSNTPPPARVRESLPTPPPAPVSRDPRPGIATRDLDEPPAPAHEAPRLEEEPDEPEEEAFTEPAEAPPPVAPVAPAPPARLAPPPMHPLPPEAYEDDEVVDDGADRETPSEEDLRAAAEALRAAHDPEARAYEPAPRGSRYGWLTALVVAAALIGVFLVVRGKVGRRAAPRAVAQTARPAPAPTQVEPAPVNSQAAALLTVIESDLGDAAAELDRDAATSERREAIKALEARDVERALMLAENAVAHDPADAESWLILGAVHLSKNDGKAAQHAFRECAEKAKVGRKDHCQALLGP
jgi:hypothetical protein